MEEAQDFIRRFKREWKDIVETPCCLVVKLCPTLVTPCSLPGSSVHGISQARIVKWVAISFSRGSS